MVVQVLTKRCGNASLLVCLEQPSTAVMSFVRRTTATMLQPCVKKWTSKRKYAVQTIHLPLVRVEQFVESEADRIVQHMVEKSLSEYVYTILACRQFNHDLDTQFSLHSFQEDKLLLLLKRNLENRGFVVRACQTHPRFGMGMRLHIYARPTLFQRALAIFD